LLYVVVRVIGLVIGVVEILPVTIDYKGFRGFSIGVVGILLL
jgi:hypothetical protein